MQDRGRELLGSNLFQTLHQLRRQLRLRAAQRPQLQGVSDHIVETDRPRTLCQSGERFGLVLKHFAAPLLVKQLVQPFSGSSVVLVNQFRVCCGKPHRPVEVAAEPAPALLVHQFGKQIVERRKIGAVLPLFFWLTATLRDAAPGTQTIISTTDPHSGIAGQQRAVRSMMNTPPSDGHFDRTGQTA